jgi:hypothetical protein
VLQSVDWAYGGERLVPEEGIDTLFLFNHAGVGEVGSMSIIEAHDHGLRFAAPLDHEPVAVGAPHGRRIRPSCARTSRADFSNQRGNRCCSP